MKSPDEMHVGPLRRSLREAISSEDVDHELYEKEEYPFRYLIGKSLDKWIEVIHPRVCDPDGQEILELATRAMVYRYIGVIHWDICEALSECESPIEQIMLGALVVVVSKKGIGVNLRPKYSPYLWPIERGRHPAPNTSAILTITPQAQIDEYRVDFLLTYEYIKTEYPDEAQELLPAGIIAITRPELAIHTPFQKNLIVECDGHDYHEKTKAQAARDKRRDRVIQALGYKIFRFTGSEIHSDSISCALEVFRGFEIDTGRSFPPIRR
jgi:hypothetical protein